MIHMTETKNNRCIVIDDDKWALLDVRNVFPWEEFGLKLTGTYLSAEEAIPVIRKENPCLVVTDICLGNENGLEMIRRLKAEGFKGEFIIISGYSEFDYAKKALEHDVCAYLLKPLDVNECRRAITKAMLRLEKKSSDSGSRDIVDEIREYMRSHFSEKTSLTDMAEHFHMNTTYFSEFFAKNMGKTFAEYRNEIRLEQAKVLLKRENDSIQNIALECGFESHAYFATQFKKAFGKTPEQYRKEK